MRIATAVLVLVAGSTAAADVVHLKGGGRLVGRVEDQGDSVRIEMAGGTTTVPKSRIESIEPKDSPQAEIARKRRELPDHDVAAALALADAAGEAGLVADRGELLALAASWAPGDEKVRALCESWRIFERELPANPAAEAALAKSLGPDARIYRTAHWRIAYDTEVAVARRRGELLEAAWRKFHRLSDRAGIAVRPIDDRLEAMVLREHAAWLAAIAMPEQDVRGMVGIYLSETGRILLYDTRTAPEAKDAEAAVSKERTAVADAQAKLDAQRGEIARVEKAITEGRAARVRDEASLVQLNAALAQAKSLLAKDREALAAREADLDRYRTELNRHFADENVSATTHEACHQLAFALGVSKPGQPMWLVEGLATLFEAQSRTSFVLEAANEGRLRDVKAAWARRENGRLADVVTDAVFLPKERRGVAYAEAWSLSYFLANRCGPDYAKFLAQGALLPPGPESAARRLEDFARFFGGDLPALEHEWRGYIEHL